MLLPGLHAIAAMRGDGLRPELAELFRARQAIAEGDIVVDLAALRDDRAVQAGPNPVAVIGDELPEGVVRFTAPAATDAINAKRPQRAVNEER